MNPAIKEEERVTEKKKKVGICMRVSLKASSQIRSRHRQEQKLSWGGGGESSLIEALAALALSQGKLPENH